MRKAPTANAASAGLQHNTVEGLKSHIPKTKLTHAQTTLITGPELRLKGVM
ncbi:MAG: hypothetical protein WA140_02305 [Geobacteraceae bacterium]